MLTRKPVFSSWLLILALLVPIAAAGCGKSVGETIDDATITARVKTALLNDPQIVKASLDRWKKLDIQIMLDDFGTGLSSLSHLNDFRVDFRATSSRLASAAPGGGGSTRNWARR